VIHAVSFLVLIAAAVYLLHLERYRPILRSAILAAFLGYVLVIVALLFDLMRDALHHGAGARVQPHAVAAAGLEARPALHASRIAPTRPA
jgi:Ni/Fe-hydrogenase subunit HybB-like protein